MRHLGKPVIEEQNRLVLEIIEQHVSAGQPYALVDFPDYPNVGDSAIWLGASNALRRITKRHPSFVCTKSLVDFDRLALDCPEGPIFICGGGNFGDIYDDHQSFRYNLMGAFPGRKIVQLPQSIHFNSMDEAKKCAEHIKRHGNFYMYVRDQRSLEFAQKAFDCSVTLAPDAAFCLGDITQLIEKEPQHDTVYLIRSDSEKASSDLTALFQTVDGPIWDWLSEPSSTSRKDLLTIVRAIASGGLSAKAFRAQHYDDKAMRRLKRGVGMLASGSRVISDRLHVHILCVLLNIPHVAFDNSYGKIHGYIDAWTKECPLVSKATTSAEAMTALAKAPFVNQGIWRRENRKELRVVG